VVREAGLTPLSIAVVDGTLSGALHDGLLNRGIDVSVYTPSTMSRVLRPGEVSERPGGVVRDGDGGHFGSSDLSRFQVDGVVRELAQAQRLGWRYARRPGGAPPFRLSDRHGSKELIRRAYDRVSQQLTKDPARLDLTAIDDVARQPRRDLID
jgi:hypothetical protein